MPDLAAVTETFTPPATVTIPGTVALEALALIDAYANVLATFRLDREPEPFYGIENDVWLALLEALGHPRGADLDGPIPEAFYIRSWDLQDAIGKHLSNGPALGAMAATRMARDISDVKARQELGYV